MPLPLRPGGDALRSGGASAFCDLPWYSIATSLLCRCSSQARRPEGLDSTPSSRLFCCSSGSSQGSTRSKHANCVSCLWGGGGHSKGHLFTVNAVVWLEIRTLDSQNRAKLYQKGSISERPPPPHQGLAERNTTCSTEGTYVAFWSFVQCLAMADTISWFAENRPTSTVFPWRCKIPPTRRSLPLLDTYVTQFC